MDYKERYEKALKRAETAINIAADKDLVKGVATTIFPELRESEDERIRKEIINFLRSPFVNENITDEKVAPWIAWLERQKYPNEDYLNNPAFLDGFDTGREVQKIFDEPTPVKLKWNEEDEENYTKLNKILYKLEYPYATDDDVDYSHKEIVELRKWFCELKDRWIWEPNDNQMSMLRAIVNDPNNVGAESCHLAMQSLYNDLLKLKEPHYTKRNALFDKCVAECDPAVMKEVSDEIDEMLRKEQKPASTEDRPYITDEHFFERESVDSFRYKLAKYMTQNSRKEESPDGYTYHISAETILEMAEEELLKRGVVQKPAEWSNEEYGRLFDIEHYLDGTLQLVPDRKIACIDFLKSLRPLQKPKYCHHDVDETGWTEEYRKAYYDGWNNCNIQHEQLKEEQKCKYQNGFVSSDGSFYPVWSEDDEDRIRQIERIAQQAGCTQKLQEEIHAWLKSLRPSWKPSEQEKGALRTAIHILTDERSFPKAAAQLQNILNAFEGKESRKDWKPSEEQMNALNFAITYFMHETSYKNPTELRDLYEDLVKLKGGVAPMRDIDE